METKSKADFVGDIERQSAWEAIITGLAASGELSPETLGAKGGEDRVKVLATHAAYLAKNFQNAYTKANG
jgi:hypothetical protein